MRYCHFTIKGETAKEQIINLTQNTFPGPQIHTGNTITCTEERSMRSSLFSRGGIAISKILIFQLDFEENKDCVQIVSGEIAWLNINPNKPSKEYRFYQEWCLKLNLEISKHKSGLPPNKLQQID